MAELTVKIDQVALLRESKSRKHPEPVSAAVLADLGGADRIAVHLSRRGRLIQDRDVRILKSILQDALVLEMAVHTETIGIAMELRPDRVLLVSEDPKIPASESALDLMVNDEGVVEAVKTLKEGAIGTAVCVEPDPEQIKMAHKIGVDMIQVHTGAYCSAQTTLKRNRAYMKIVDAVHLIRKLKIGIGLGHHLCYRTVKSFTSLPHIDDFLIGHSIVSRAVMVGMERAVREMAALIRPAVSP